jgi:RsiW-degrading membrane proteinase PrsW (M82 family)
MLSDSLFTFIKAYPIIFAALFGIIPAIVWLWFWLKEDIHPEPTKFIIFCFLGGMLAVFVALPLQHIVEGWTSDYTILFFLWAFIEEALKFAAAWMGGIHTTADDEPIDPVIYMIVAALGFVAMENTLFLIDPLISGNLADTIITGNLRFIGATLLHIISSSTIGIFYALSFNKARSRKIIYVLSGFILAVLLHAVFNLLIMNSVAGSLFVIFGVVWTGLILLMLLLERIKITGATNNTL